MEIYHSLEGAEEEQKSGGKAHGFMGIIVQIAIIDIIFSLDSVITAVGLVQNVPVMVAAIVISV
ncbi:TerC family protein, partial [Klebsiella pneumoniae]